ncbi:GPI-anchored small secreted protein [Laccaria bicolor S238N-H82]|uniref:GPI-anchored small secreted protein n=1 Tax=Laccaria bicolor (strain S238N-H82 / ATCC MYA-4686) TaxID=486041 RepID=B0D1Z5_LACBS|nr:GPI-anchored small secreted protein [Laccaria bicolor S238N-H82]XP_001886172.1 GPI-anchored small secreted protein [Laccaria bicolor S238N-H82]XP_001887646.1 GPI-anchored small secreted protein [Laccaria bicolor S238N-H82]EDR01570.1 GPI-anchored small secreted protein [Laccaria bicolor S238N-H82]EDR03031.1 GPI-anchored small secreted protein [Laccaria bicolor S238N-H82]EDR11727.1 GPI-anchored small secreted protein [Laccaria bicolor S238N-H82]|eukprot:XP_001877624.1 GPI-anchored small secreted protein [Laccaria bicolor S238N-H82]
MLLCIIVVTALNQAHVTRYEPKISNHSSWLSTHRALRLNTHRALRLNNHGITNRASVTRYIMEIVGTIHTATTHITYECVSCGVDVWAFVVFVAVPTSHKEGGPASSSLRPHLACIILVTIQLCPHPSKRGGAFVIFVAVPTSLKEGEGPASSSLLQPHPAWIVLVAVQPFRRLRRRPYIPHSNVVAVVSKHRRRRQQTPSPSSATLSPSSATLSPSSANTVTVISNVVVAVATNVVTTSTLLLARHWGRRSGGQKMLRGEAVVVVLSFAWC